MSDELERATMRRVSLRLLPLLFVLYIAAFLDRTNVGLAALQMNQDLSRRHFTFRATRHQFGRAAGVLDSDNGLFSRHNRSCSAAARRSFRRRVREFR
jgi:hypothetical protein